MASKTTYYGLDMPGYNDIADIDVINGNMSKIDEQMKKNADSAQQSKYITSDEYSATKTYAVGDYCIRENVLYRCKTAITTGESFDSNKWVQTTCGSEFVALNSNLSIQMENCVYSGTIENCITNLANSIKDGQSTTFSLMRTGDSYYFGFLAKFTSSLIGGIMISAGGKIFKIGGSEDTPTVTEAVVA